MESCLDFCAAQKGNVSVLIYFHINWTACNSPGQNLVKDQYQALLWRITSLILKIISKNAQNTFDSHTPLGLNLVQFLTSILISLAFHSFLTWKSQDERNSCSFMPCYNSNMSVLPGLTTSDFETNARPLWATPSLTA